MPANPNVEGLRRLAREMKDELGVDRLSYQSDEGKQLLAWASRINEIADALEAQMHSGPEVMQRYVPGYVQTCESCGGPIKLPKFERLSGKERGDG